MADFKVIPAAAGSGYVTIEDNGSTLPQETKLNFVGPNVTVVDNPGNGSTDVTITNGTFFPWTVVTTNTTLVVDNGYFANGGSSLTFTLPTSAGTGSTFRIAGMSASGFSIAQNAGQSIVWGNLTSTTGVTGGISSGSKGDSIEIVCNVANTGFQVVDSNGDLAIT